MGERRTPAGRRTLGADRVTARRVEVRTASHTYEVLIGTGLLADLAVLSQQSLKPAPHRVLLIADSGLPPTTVAAAASALSAGIETRTVHAVATERDKSLASFERLHAEAVRFGVDRGDAIIALGGGIVGDLAGFVAATHRRGLRVIQCPTTLLAMVDASVGGKTGVNLLADGMLHKNFVGSFHQPHRVIASVDVLSSLDDRQFRSGLAECIKHAMISGPTDPDLGAWTSTHLDAILARDTATLIELIARNVAVKVEIVAGDERETAPTGGRALLNLGHTFAHAIETIDALTPDGDPHHAPLLHGEAVSLGLVAATAAAASLGRVESALLDDTITLLQRAGLPTSVAGLPPTEDIIARMTHDKKAVAGVPRLILPASRGVCESVRNPPQAAMKAGIDQIRAPG